MHPDRRHAPVRRVLGRRPSSPGPDPEFVVSRATERLIFFSDAVVAIAITLLAIDLPLPEGGTTKAFLTSVGHNHQHYIAFLISFFVIAASWSNHHDVFRYLVRVDAPLRNQNMAWLFTIVLNPFATKLLIVSGSSTPLRYAFYALIQMLSSLLVLTMLRHMRTANLVPDAPPGVLRDGALQSWTLVVSFGLSIPVFFATSYGWLLWILAPMIIGRVTDRYREADDPGLA